MPLIRIGLEFVLNKYLTSNWIKGFVTMLEKLLYNFKLELTYLGSYIPRYVCYVIGYTLFKLWEWKSS